MCNVMIVVTVVCDGVWYGINSEKKNDKDKENVYSDV